MKTLIDNRILKTTILTLTALLLFAASALAATAPKTKRVSVKSNGKEINTDNEFASVSANGRYVTFESPGKFTSGDKGGFDVFVHDRATGKTVRASVKANGKEVPGADSEFSSISANGRYVAFVSNGRFTKQDKDNYGDVYVKDMKTGKVTLASLDSNGKQVPGGAGQPIISANGHSVLFLSDGAYVPTDTNGRTDIYVRDLTKGTTVRASLRSDGTESDADVTSPSISGNGRYVAFQSMDQKMTADSDYGFAVDSDVFVRDLKTGKTIRASLKADGTEISPSQNNANVDPVISANGKFLAFYSDAYGHYAADDNNNDYDVYVKNLRNGSLARASVTSAGNEVTALGGAPQSLGASERPLAISANGRRIAFEAYAALDPIDTNMERDVYVHDMKTGQTTLASVASKGAVVTSGAGGQQLPAISGNGKWIAFETIAKVTGHDADQGPSTPDFDVFERGPLH